jgi:hypothetical protein
MASEPVPFGQIYNNVGIATNFIQLGSYSIPSLATVYNSVSDPTATQSLTAGYITGDISSANFQTGVAGWKLSYLGDFEGNTGTFRGALTGNTITGATFQTALSGTRIRILSASGTTPTQSANSIAFIDASNNVVGFIGTGYGSLNSNFLISPTTDVSAGYFYDASGVALTSNLVNVYMSEPTSSGIALLLQQNGTGTGLQVFSVGTGVGLLLQDNTQSSSADLMYINSGSAYTTAQHILKSNYGYGFYLNSSFASNNYQAAYIVNAGSSVGLYVQQTNASNAGIGLYVGQAHSQTSAVSFQGTVSSTHFYKIATLQTTTIWCSDGTTPNGNLGGNIGDWCMNGDSGKPYWNNNGSTGWTAF